MDPSPGALWDYLELCLKGFLTLLCWLNSAGASSWMPVLASQVREAPLAHTLHHSSVTLDTLEGGWTRETDHLRMGPTPDIQRKAGVRVGSPVAQNDTLPFSALPASLLASCCTALLAQQWGEQLEPTVS